MNDPIPMSVLTVLSNFPDFESARQCVEVLMDKRLIACANIFDGSTSYFRWQGKVQIASEIPVFFKTTLSQYALFEAELLALHPYDVPEILALPAELGLQSYVHWVAQQVGAPPPSKDAE